MARTNEWTETLVDWVDGRLRQNRFSNLWLGGGPGADGGSSYRPIDGQLTQRHVCYDTSEDASPCSPSGFSSLVDNLRRIRYWQEPATWFGAETTSGLKITIKPGLWYPSTTEYCAFAGGDSPTFTLPSGVLDRIDTVYVDASGILHIQHGTPAVSPTITLPPIASGIPLWAVHLPSTASGVYFQTCSGYYAGQAYIERDLRPFLNLGGGGVVGSGVLPPHNRGAILRGGVADWETYNVGAANEVLTNDGTDVMWSSKSLVIEENSILNQDLTTDASVTFADVFVPNGGTFGISGNELLTVNAAGNFTFSGVTSIVVPDGTWVGADADCAWLFNSTSGYVTTQDTTGVGTAAPEGMLDVAYGGYTGKMTLLLGADLNAITRTNNTNKRTIMGSYHYIDVEQPVAMLYAFSSSIISRLDIGGGHVYCNAATEVSIYTAADTTTVTGTKRFSIDDTGAITVTGPSLTVPDGWWVGIGAAAERIVIDTAGYIAFRGCNIGIGLAVPNQKLTVEGTIDLKEQAAAGADVASYGQIWVKNTAPNELWFTDDDGTDVQLGLGGGGLPAVAGAGYALISDGVNSWVADQTPAWTGEHSFGAAVAFTGATGVNAITIPDNLANALHIIDAGDADVYLQIVTTTGSEEVIFNAGGDDVDFTIQAVGVADALQVQGSDGQITLGALTAGYVKSSAGGVLSVATEVPLIDLGSYTQGDLIYGGAADYQDLAIGAIGDFLWVNAAGTEPEWHTLIAGDIPAHALLGTQHSDTTTDAPTRGSLIYANATPLWDELVHPGGSGYALATSLTDVFWDQTPLWMGEHSFEAGIAFTGASGANEITVADNIAIALELLDAGGLEYMRIISTDTQPATVFNNGEADVDFRVAASGITNGLVVQGSDGHVAIGAASDADKKLYLYENITVLAGTKYGAHIKLAASPAAASAVSHYGMWVQAEMATNSNVSRIAGMLFHAIHSGTGAVTDAFGVIGKAAITNGIAGTIVTSYGGFFFTDIEDGAGTTSTGVQAYTPFVDTGSLTTGHGVYIKQGTVGGGAITTLHGLHIEAINAGGTNYAIYSAGGNSYHAGHVGIAMVPTANGLLCIGTPTENTEFIDAGSAGATEQDWIEVEIGGVQGYIRVFAAK